MDLMQFENIPHPGPKLHSGEVTPHGTQSVHEIKKQVDTMKRSTSSTKYVANNSVKLQNAVERKSLPESNAQLFSLGKGSEPLWNPDSTMLHCAKLPEMCKHKYYLPLA